MKHTKIVPVDPTEEIERLRADNAELEKEAVWIRNKLGLPSDVKLLSGDITLAGTMHKIVSHAKGYVTYIESLKCDDKQGEIARQSVHIITLESHNRDLLAANQVLREALTKIASLSQDDDLLWWQKDARAALAVKSGDIALIEIGTVDHGSMIEMVPGAASMVKFRDKVYVIQTKSNTE